MSKNSKKKRQKITGKCKKFNQKLLIGWDSWQTFVKNTKNCKKSRKNWSKIWRKIVKKSSKIRQRWVKSVEN